MLNTEHHCLSPPWTADSAPPQLNPNPTRSPSMAATFSPPSLVAQRPVSPKSKQTIDGTRLRRTRLAS
ncbi:hypothetical protein AAT19DRAFT_14444 [Rhodotorula toruloides]|uniref:Uncharacterized protein n=1 Tax=Rhodotorula toruloides TaxID=5286 RepID=A0A2T0ABN5_RHOTO|nr:hypothetical protein AAT19DRAFT_14444 [Rhodotorula toruloides]